MQLDHQGIYQNLVSQAEKVYRHNRQGSYRTRARYYAAYKRFLNYVAETYHLQKISNINSKHVNAYVKFLQDKNLSAATVKTELSAIRFWHDQIPSARHKLPGNDELNLKRRRFGGVDRTWSNAEFNRMLAECTLAERPDYAAVITLGRYMGLRIHECFRIDAAMARDALKTDRLRVKGKGGLTREIPLHPAARSALEKHLKMAPPGHKLFVPMGTKTHTAIKELQNFIAAKRAVVQAVAHYPNSRRSDSDECERKSNKPLTFHGLRHTRAAEWYIELIEGGASELVARVQVSRWLGHRRDDITKVYLASLEQGGGADE